MSVNIMSILCKLIVMIIASDLCGVVYSLPSLCSHLIFVSIILAKVHDFIPSRRKQAAVPFPGPGALGSPFLASFGLAKTRFCCGGLSCRRRPGGEGTHPSLVVRGLHSTGSSAGVSSLTAPPIHWKMGGRAWSSFWLSPAVGTPL